MFSEVYYIIRSRTDGRYLTAHPEDSNNPKYSGYLLVFKADFEALSFLNTHGADVASRLAVESVPGNQLKNLLQRWGFAGIGWVQDPLIPRVEFLSQEG